MAREKRFDWASLGHAELISEVGLGMSMLHKREEELRDARALLQAGGYPDLAEELEPSEIRRVS